MVKRLFLSLIVSFSLYGDVPSSTNDLNTSTLLSEEEAFSLFVNMALVVSKNYYHNDEVKINVEEYNSLKDNHSLTKQNLYALFNSKLEGKSGFYTESELIEKFAAFIDKKSHIEIKYIGDVLYLKVQNLKEENLLKLKQALSDQPKKILLDLRDNIDAELDSSVKFVNMFLDSGNIVSYRYLDDGKMKVKRFIADKESSIVSGAKVGVLVNENTASVFEAIAASLKYIKNIKVFGNDTSGNAHSYTMGILENGDAYILNNGEYFYYRKFMSVDRIGIHPSIRVSEDNPKFDKTLIEALQYLKAKS